MAVFLENNFFEFIYQDLNWRWHFFECFLDGTISDCVHQIGMLISWTCKKLQLMFLVCGFSHWLISKAISWNSFDEVTIEMFLGKFDLFVKMICCLFDHFLLCHIDGKYRSATVPLVSSFAKKIWIRMQEEQSTAIHSWLWALTKVILCCCKSFDWSQMKET